MTTPAPTDTTTGNTLPAGEGTGARGAAEEAAPDAISGSVHTPGRAPGQQILSGPAEMRCQPAGGSRKGRKRSGASA